MTNEEKAKELRLKYIDEGCGDSTDIRCACEEMAEWKDNQFISMLPEIFDYFENVVGLYDGGLNHSDVDKPAFVEYFSNIIAK